jgi:hypothetical protein
MRAACPLWDKPVLSDLPADGNTFDRAFAARLGCISTLQLVSLVRAR